MEWKPIACLAVTSNCSKKSRLRCGGSIVVTRTQALELTTTIGNPPPNLVSTILFATVWRLRSVKLRRLYGATHVQLGAYCTRRQTKQKVAAENQIKKFAARPHARTALGRVITADLLV